MNNKPIYVTFSENKLEESFEKLSDGKFQDKNSHKFINRAIVDLKQNCSCGIKIPKKLWPRVYVKKYNLTNL